MEWTMPRPVLQAVAALLVLGAAGSFALGVLHAPDRGRMPGEPAPGGRAGAASVIEAPEATPLSQERIEGPPKTVEKAPTNTTDEDEEATNTTAPAVSATPILKVPPPPLAINATNTVPATNTQATNTTPSEEAPPF